LLKKVRCMEQLSFNCEIRDQPAFAMFQLPTSHILFVTSAGVLIIFPGIIIIVCCAPTLFPHFVRSAALSLQLRTIQNKIKASAAKIFNKN